eukprot:TRINITY_DN8553_c0_g1_i1.p1 TRINITY_DN8553_c0_g1~~TRINITY_DN8553_c0_g1_i1.p1  ORF type:complete len:103 (+),score=4.17 TRINITY_DN8553_c0_g1_i1:274-582(+)
MPPQPLGKQIQFYCAKIFKPLAGFKHVKILYCKAPPTLHCRHKSKPQFQVLFLATDNVLRKGSRLQERICNLGCACEALILGSFRYRMYQTLHAFEISLAHN